MRTVAGDEQLATQLQCHESEESGACTPPPELEGGNCDCTHAPCDDAEDDVGEDGGGGNKGGFHETKHAKAALEATGSQDGKTKRELRVGHVVMHAVRNASK